MGFVTTALPPDSRCPPIADRRANDRLLIGRGKLIHDDTWRTLEGGPLAWPKRWVWRGVLPAGITTIVAETVLTRPSTRTAPRIATVARGIIIRGRPRRCPILGLVFSVVLFSKEIIFFSHSKLVHDTFQYLSARVFSKANGDLEIAQDLEL